MTTTVTFGEALHCKLALDEFTFLGADRKNGLGAGSPASAVREALANPDGFPAISAATVPGDHVAIAIDRGVPQMASVLAGVIAAMLDAHVAPAMITIVSLGPIDDREDLNRQLVEMGAGAVRFEQHDPEDERAVAMVGVNSQGEPLRLNRTIAEADFVLPVGAARLPTGENTPTEKFASLFPQFSNRETVDRIQSEAASESAKVRKRRSREVDEAGWLLGVGMTVSVVPGAGGSVAAVLAGDPGTIAQAGANQSRAIWERSVERQGDLVIATVVGDQREQTWDNLARAISAAAPLVEPGGAIAICSQLDEPPSGSLNRLLEAVDFGGVQQELMLDGEADAHRAIVLAQALESGPVYLMSRLPADIVESLGMTPIQDDQELARLAAGRDHCIVIEEAQRVVPRLVNRDER